MEVGAFTSDITKEARRNNIFGKGSRCLVRSITITSRGSLGRGLSTVGGFGRHCPSVRVRVVLIPGTTGIVRSGLPTFTIATDRDERVDHMGTRLKSSCS